MPHLEFHSLWELTYVGHPPGRFLADRGVRVTLDELRDGSIIGNHLEKLKGRNVLIATSDQLTTALALIELDGVAQRLVLCPPGLPSEHISSILDVATIDAVISDHLSPETAALNVERIICGPRVVSGSYEHSKSYETEWVLLTSGTSGLPKLVSHTLSSLMGAITNGETPEVPTVWSTFYDIRRYGGLQILLRALLGQASIVLSNASESVGDFLVRAGANGVTRISGTPSHWRRVLLSPMKHRIKPQYIRLSGEIADQTVLDSLRTFYPAAKISHAFASTEAGVAFDVIDGFAGFPASIIQRHERGVELKIESGSLRIRSPRVAKGYLGNEGDRIASDLGFVDTGDMVELRGDRYYFVGRRGGVINVGGMKVYPEDVEAVINRHPRVRMSLVKARRNSIVGAIVVADVVAAAASDIGGSPCDLKTLETQILEWCREELAPYKVPAAIRFVSSINVGASGKVARANV